MYVMPVRHRPGSGMNGLDLRFVRVAVSAERTIPVRLGGQLKAMWSRILGCSLVIGGLGACLSTTSLDGRASSVEQVEPSSEFGLSLSPDSVDSARVERVLASMSIEEKLAQMVLAYPQRDEEGPVRVGGVLFVGRLLHDVDGAKAGIRDSRSRARIPPFYAVDMEGGRFNRMATHPDLQGLPSAREFARMPTAEVEVWGRRVGLAMRDLGLNLNLAPVLDVSPSGHMATNGRSFSGDPLVVQEKAQAYARGLLSAGVLPVGKHFPGYGDLARDTDREPVSADWSAEQVKEHIRVFIQSQDVLGGMMMSNVVYEAFGDKPAFLNRELIAIARSKNRIAVTDDLAIGVLAQHVDGTSETLVKQAFLAGNDLLLFTTPPDWKGGVDMLGVLTATLREQPELEERVDDSCRRLLSMKDRLGLLDGL